MFEKEYVDPNQVCKSAYHAMDIDTVLEQAGSSKEGLSQSAVRARLQQYGHNIIPEEKLKGILGYFMDEFKSPLIYILLAATLMSLIVAEWADALFISLVIIINAIIGAAQELSSQKSNRSLQENISQTTNLIREGEPHEVDTTWVVPGDIVILETGSKITADLRLIESQDLNIDESVFTGKADPIHKDADCVLDEETPPNARRNIIYSGCTVSSGKGKGVVIATGERSQLGKLSDLIQSENHKAPFLLRIEELSNNIAIIVGCSCIALALIAFMEGLGLMDVLLLIIALAVSAIPEGMAVAVLGAFTISMARMSRNNIIVKNMVAVESLGTCDYIIARKTGIFTERQTTVTSMICLPDSRYDITGIGKKLSGEIVPVNDANQERDASLIKMLCEGAVLSSQGYLARKDSGWVLKGGHIETAILIWANKCGVRQDMLRQYKVLSRIYFDQVAQYNAVLVQHNDEKLAFARGSIEKILPMCTSMHTLNGREPIDTDKIQALYQSQSEQGYNLVAIAGTELKTKRTQLEEGHLKEMFLLGFLILDDPIKPEAVKQIQIAKRAGVNTALIAGDNPTRALAIAKKLKLTDNPAHIVTGEQIENCANDEELDELILNAKVFTRITPKHRIQILNSLENHHHHIAMTGEGANDAPSLRHAHVGIAFSKSSSDIVQESADVLLEEENFGTIVKGVEQGRVAYNNLRKVIYLLLSTGVAEIILFMLALFTNNPLPLMPVQLLWLNLVTNGIQDIALAFEKEEGDELLRKPRNLDDPIFNRLMIERTIIAAAWMGVTAFILFISLIHIGFEVADARNSTLLLMVLFENTHVFNARSEKLSVFKHNLMLNPFLLFGTLAAQGIHQLANYTPWLNEVLEIKPVSMTHWIELFLLALTLIAAMEIHKYFRKT